MSSEKTLYDIKKGERARIVEIKDKATRTFCSKLGIEKSTTVFCIAKFGNVVIQKNHQQIALGREIARDIIVKEC